MSRSGPGRGRYGRKTRDEVIYEQFLELRMLCRDDPDWYELLDDYSRGLFRKKVRFSAADNKLTFTIRGKQTELTIVGDPQLILESFKELHRKIGVKSEAEVTYEKEKFQKKSEKGWSSVHKLGDKKFHIDRYIDRLKIIRGMTEEQVIDLRHNIFMGLLTGKIQNKNVKFKGNRIIEIEIKK